MHVSEEISTVKLSERGVKSVVAIGTDLMDCGERSTRVGLVRQNSSCVIICRGRLVVV